MDIRQFPAGNFSLSLASLCRQSCASGIEKTAMKLVTHRGRTGKPVARFVLVEVDVGVPVGLPASAYGGERPTKAQAAFGAWRDTHIGAAAKFPLAAGTDLAQSLGGVTVLCVRDDRLCL